MRVKLVWQQWESSPCALRCDEHELSELLTFGELQEQVHWNASIMHILVHTKGLETITLNKYHVIRTLCEQEYAPCTHQTHPGTWRATLWFPRETEGSRRWRRSALLLTETACRSRCRSLVREASPDHNQLTHRTKHVMCNEINN